MEGHAGGSKGSAFAACQEHVGLFCTIPSDPVVVVVVGGWVVCSPCWQSSLVP